MNIEVKAVKKSFSEISNVVKPYANFILEEVNNHCIRIAVMDEEYKWHYHAHTDELFIVLEGELTIEIKDQDTAILKPGEFIKIPAKTVHKTSATKRTVNLTFEKIGEDTIFVDQHQ
jgi:mannose-6-phosphate isomerase-like protein (cupin superfamily)